ncbi:MAG: flagellar hook-length control protein FliK [Alkalibacterium sp.]|nr:flagellar hook-length control protein FliK [Alkalibacterium sp.]
MNVTAVNQIAAGTQGLKKSELKDGAAFSQELKKHMTHSNDTEAYDLTEDLSQSVVKEDLEDESQEMEEANEFVIIPAFLRFDREIEHSSAMLTEIHKDDQLMDSRVTQENSDILVKEGEAVNLSTDFTQSLVDSETDLILTEIGTEKNSEKIKLTTLSDVKMDNVEITDDSIFTGKQDTLKGVTEDIISMFESQVTEEIEMDKDALKQVQQTINDSESYKTETIVSTADSIEKKVELKVPDLTEVSESKKAEQLLSENKLDSFLSESLTDKKVVSNSVERASEVMKSDTTNEQLQPQISHPQLSQVSELSEKMIQSLPATATLEQSPEVIQDLMMTVSSKDTGDNVYQSTLTLTPETLGEIKVEITYSDEGLTGRLVFETEEAKQYIENQWQQIKAPLEMKGLQLEGFEFQVVEPHDFTQSNNLNYSQQSDQSKRDQQEERRESAQSKNGVEEEEVVVRPGIKNGNGLNYYA